MLAGVTLSYMWMHRNYAKHRDQQLPPAHVILDATFVTWMG